MAWSTREQSINEHESCRLGYPDITGKSTIETPFQVRDFPREKEKEAMVFARLEAGGGSNFDKVEDKAR